MMSEDENDPPYPHIELKMPTFGHIRFSSRAPEVPLNCIKRYQSSLIQYKTVRTESRYIKDTGY